MHHLPGNAIYRQTRALYRQLTLERTHTFTRKTNELTNLHKRKTFKTFKFVLRISSFVFLVNIGVCSNVS